VRYRSVAPVPDAREPQAGEIGSFRYVVEPF
jgi:hypothetical protein